MLDFCDGERSTVSFDDACDEQKVTRLLLTRILVLDVYALLYDTVITFSLIFNDKLIFALIFRFFTALFCRLDSVKYWALPGGSVLGHSRSL